MGLKIIRTGADIEEGLAALLQADPRLEAISRKAGALPLRLQDPGFSGLAHIVVSQVVSRASANAIWGRMVVELGEVTAENYLDTASAQEPAFGLSRAKARTLHGIASAIVEGRLDLETLHMADDLEASARLMSLSGVGPWTAQVYLMFCGGRVDIFPAGDIALQAAVAHAFEMSARPDAKILAETALLWSPWRSVAARLFWAYYAVITRREALPIA